MEGEREILEFKVDATNLSDWMETNKPMLMGEIVAASEELVYKRLEELDAFKIVVKEKVGRTILNTKIRKDDLVESLDMMMEWAVETEEYELAHRIKLLKEYSEKPKDDIRPKAVRRTRKTK